MRIHPAAVGKSLDSIEGYLAFSKLISCYHRLLHYSPRHRHIPISLPGGHHNRTPQPSCYRLPCTDCRTADSTMLVAELLSAAQPYWPILLLSAIAFHLLRNKFYNGLQKYPGPALAAYTNWWRFAENFSRASERTFIALHRRHGDIVRVGPDVLSFADPRAIKDIYGLNKGFTKSDFYPVQQAVERGVRLQSLFSTKDEAFHAKYRRCVNSAFAMSSLVSYEPLVDGTIEVFLEQTQRLYCDQAAVCNFSRWLQFYAFDVIGEITWSKRLGFLEKNEDVDGIIAFLARFLSYAGPVSAMDREWRERETCADDNRLVKCQSLICFSRRIRSCFSCRSLECPNRSSQLLSLPRIGRESVRVR